MNHYGVEELQLEEGDLHARMCAEEGFKTEFQERLRQIGREQWNFPLALYLRGLTVTGQKGCYVLNGRLRQRRRDRNGFFDLRNR